MISNLPEDYRELGEKYMNMPFVNIMCSSPTRIYYKDRKYHCFITSTEGILPITSPQALPLAKTLNDVLKNDVLADMLLWHPTNWCAKKKVKLSNLTGEYEEGYTDIILKYLLLLI